MFASLHSLILLFSGVAQVLLLDTGKAIYL